MDNALLIKTRTYTREELGEAAVIVHPKLIRHYGISLDDVGLVFERGSNFAKLGTPIVDRFGNEHWRSESYYMAQRLYDPVIQRMLAENSLERDYAKEASIICAEFIEDNEELRAEYMRNAVREKFLNDKKSKEALKQTGEKDIIELTYWGDRFFGIAHTDLTGANILWKLLVETRELVMRNL